MFQLAQLNIAKFRRPMADPVNADFVAALDAVNAAAELQSGFCWRLVGSGDNATDAQAFDDPNMLVNLSVWQDIESLANFVYRDDVHLKLMRRRREWFDAVEFHLVLWWVIQGHRPGVAEARQRLDLLAKNGPSEAAFTFRHPRRMPGSESQARGHKGSSGVFENLSGDRNE